MPKKPLNVFDSFDRTTNKKTIDLKNPWFRVVGQRGTYQFSRYCEQGSRKWVEAFGPEGWRAFYVGERPYKKLGITVRPYRLRGCRPGETPEGKKDKERAKKKSKKNTKKS